MKLSSFLLCLMLLGIVGSALAQNEPPAWREVVVEDLFGNPTALAAGDISNNGIIDVVAVGDAGIRWWLNNGDDTFTVREFAPNFLLGSSVHVLDMNSDGDDDIIATGDDNKVLYWENNGGGQWLYYAPSVNFPGVSYCYPGDFDNDGDTDIAVGGDVGLRWFSNTGGGTFSQRDLDNEFTNPSCIWAGDMDGDWDDDMVVTRGSQIHWFRNNGFNDWTEYSLDENYAGANHCSVADINGDGHLDILTSGDFGINWWRNDGAMNFTMLVYSPQFHHGTCVTSTDIDDDGMADIVGTGRDSYIRWWQNQGGVNDWLDFSLDEDYWTPTFCYVYDFEDDGDMDILTSNSTDDDVTLWLNQPPDVQVTINQIITDGFPVVINFVSVLDGDSNPIHGLNNGNFSVWENEVAQGPITVAPVAEDDDMSVAFVMDYSGSMSATDVTDMEDAAATFVGNFQPGDRGAIVKFSASVQLVQPYTDNTTLLTNQIYANWPGQGSSTALWQAVYEGLEETDPELNRKAVIALTDGFSNTGTNSLQDCVNLSETTGIPVFTIGLGGSTNTTDLEYLATETGGAYYYAPTSADLAEIYAEINEVLDNQYLVIYTSNNPVQDGSVRNVYMEVEYNGFTGTDQSSYQAPGVPALFIDIDPVSPPIQIPANGGSFNFTATLANNQAFTIFNVDAWTQAILPDGTVYGPIFQHTFPALPAGFELNFNNLSQFVPSNGPTGLYTFQALIGDYPNTVQFQDEFNFTKLPFVTDSFGDPVTGWALEGWDYGIAGLEDSSFGLPGEFAIGTAYPNPFNPTTTVAISLPETAELTLNVFNVAGQQVATLVNGQVNAGQHNFVFDGAGLSSGIYFIHANVAGQLNEIQKVTLMK
jgi:VWFA-related protein